MHKRTFFLYILLITISYSQTHFTVPQNVWRIGMAQGVSSGKWKGHNGKNGWQDYSYDYIGTNYRLTRNQHRTVRFTALNLEYGLSDRSTFSLNIPYFNNLKESSDWEVSTDTLKFVMDSLLNFYYPNTREESGLGDITLGINVLLYGKPAWSGRGKYSLFGGLEVVMPFAERLHKFNSTSVDSLGRPKQFNQLPLGGGLTEWRIKAFGEFFRRFKQRLINITWAVSISRHSRELINNPVTFLWTDQTNPDSINAAIGSAVLYQQGNNLRGIFAGKIELWPERIFFSAEMEWVYRSRDQYNSNNNTWDNWMAHRANYDTKQTLVRQSVRLNLMNVDPLKKYGPLPFELEFGARWFVPILTTNTFGYTEAWIKFSSYFQGW